MGAENEMKCYKHVKYKKQRKYKSYKNLDCWKTGATPEVCQRLPLDCCEVGWSP